MTPSPNALTISAPLGDTEVAAEDEFPLPPLLPFGLLARCSSCGIAAAARAINAPRNSGTVSGTAGPVTGAGVARARAAQNVVIAMNFMLVVVGL